MQNACKYCNARIYSDKYDIWRHYETGLMLCQPDEDKQGFDGVIAYPMFTEEEIDAAG